MSSKHFLAFQTPSKAPLPKQGPLAQSHEVSHPIGSLKLIAQVASCTIVRLVYTTFFFFLVYMYHFSSCCCFIT